MAGRPVVEMKEHQVAQLIANEKRPVSIGFVALRDGGGVDAEAESSRMYLMENLRHTQHQRKRTLPTNTPNHCHGVIPSLQFRSYSCTAVYTFIGIKTRASTRYEVVDYEDIKYSHNRFRSIF